MLLPIIDEMASNVPIREHPYKSVAQVFSKTAAKNPSQG